MFNHCVWIIARIPGYCFKLKEHNLDSHGTSKVSLELHYLNIKVNM